MKPFKSDALGETHEYRALFSDRVKISVAAALAEAVANLPCRKDDGEWQQIGHSQVQISQVLADMNEADDGGDTPAPKPHAAAHAPMRRRAK